MKIIGYLILETYLDDQFKGKQYLLVKGGYVDLISDDPSKPTRCLKDLYSSERAAKAVACRYSKRDTDKRFEVVPVDDRRFVHLDEIIASYSC